MAKKHRVKRQKYVDYLVELEKKRDAYIEKRRAPKRGREMRNNEEVAGGEGDLIESKVLKKRRTEAAEEQNMLDEEEHQPPVRPSSRTSEKRAPASASTALTDSSEKKTVFAARPFSELAEAKASETSEPASSAKLAAAKKSLKRRHY